MGPEASAVARGRTLFGSRANLAPLRQPTNVKDTRARGCACETCMHMRPAHLPARTHARPSDQATARVDALDRTRFLLEPILRASQFLFDYVIDAYDRLLLVRLYLFKATNF